MGIETVNVLRLGIGGMISAADPTLLNETAYAFAINVGLKNGRICTRPGMIELLATQDDPNFREFNIQGACFYNPAKGQSALVFANDASSIMVSAAGRKFLIQPHGGKMTIENVSNGFVGYQSGLLTNLYQAEVYCIAQDGMSPTWIYQHGTTAVLSKGYNTVDKESSELANGATVGGYIHGRIFQVVDSRKILVGDIIHKTDLTDASNLLKTTEQVYWATGAQFSPPSSMGNVLGAGVLPLRDTRHGHGDLMLFCEDGTFSLDLSQYPRSNWSNLSLTKHALLDSSARGPYAITHFDGDLVYRSRQGMHSLRSAAAPPQQAGNPDRPLSEAVGDVFRQDNEELLKFASVSKLAREERIFSTIQHVVEGVHRRALAIMSLNLTPLDASGQRAAAWEGLWVAPPEVGGIVQMVNGIFNGREQCYALTRSKGGVNSLAEISAQSEKDILATGEMKRISCVLVTRAITGTQDPLARYEIMGGTLFLKGIRDRVNVRFYWRANAGDSWRLSVEKEIGTDPENCLIPQGPISYAMPIGVSSEKGTRFQFKIEWDGYLEIDALRIKASYGDPEDGADGSEPPTIHPADALCDENPRSMIELLSTKQDDCKQ